MDESFVQLISHTLVWAFIFLLYKKTTDSIDVLYPSSETTRFSIETLANIILGNWNGNNFANPYMFEDKTLDYMFER